MRKYTDAEMLYEDEPDAAIALTAFREGYVKGAPATPRAGGVR